MPLLPWLLLVGAATPLVAMQTDTHGIHAVPVPGAVAIDGRLDDWDLSGEVLQCYDVETLSDLYSGRIALMHDATNCYISIRWKDPIPLGNCHDPRFTPGKGWAGDCVQLRIKTDRICHLTAWYHAASEEPFINVDYGKNLDEPFGGGGLNLHKSSGWKLDRGAEMAFLADADGKGYVQEMKIPWSLITESGARPTDRFACGIELLWGEADWPVHRYADNLADGATSREFFWTAHQAWGTIHLEPTGKLKLPEPSWMRALTAAAPDGPVAIDYSLPRDARVTIAIDDATGKRVRNLLPAAPRKAGANSERWDGLDDDGAPVPPGEYRIKGLHHQGIHLSYAMSFANPGIPSWQTSDGRGAFYGDHACPIAAAAAGDHVALACAMGEAGQHLIGCDLNGQRLWGLANRSDGLCTGLAAEGATLWVADESKRAIVYRVDLPTGRYAPWERTAKDAEGRDYRVLDLLVSDHARTGGNHGGNNLRGIAVRNGVLAACFFSEGLVRMFDARTGDRRAEHAIPKAQAVTFAADGALIVLAEDRLVRIAADGKTAPFAAAMPGAHALASDRDGLIYVSLRGSDHNVRVFSPDGKPVREIGVRGGRPASGRFNDLGMRNPAGVAVDAKGRVWVCEEVDNPKRTSVWSADGALLADYIGTTSYAGAGAINPFDASMGFANNTVFSIDLKTGAWRPTWSLGASDHPDDLFPTVCENLGRQRVLVHDGATYVWSCDFVEVHCTMLKDGVWRSVAHTGVVRAAEAQKNPAANLERYRSPLFAGHDGELYAWSDADGDGRAQAGEIAFGAKAAIAFPWWGQIPDSAGTVVYLGPGTATLVRLPITGWNRCGAPLYDPAKPVVTDFGRSTGENANHLMGGSDGRAYVNQSPLTAFARDGKIIGTYPSRHLSVHGSHTATAARPGYLIGTNAVLGTAPLGADGDEVFSINGNLGENYLFTHDCLWIQALFKDTRGGFDTPSSAVRGMPMDATTAGGESFGGNFTRTSNGKVYLTIGGTDARVIEVTGLDTIVRFTGAVTYNAAQYAQAQQLALDKAAAVAVQKAFVIPRLTAPITIDGAATDWSELAGDAASTIEIAEDAQHRYGRVAMRWDASHLYIAWRVTAREPRLRNAGQDERMLFKTGDCVDLMLHSTGAEDGLRLLVSALGGTPTAVLYEKTVPGTAAGDRVPFASPWRSIAFDRVGRPSDVAVASAPCDGGFLVEAKVPWTRLGAKPASGMSFAGDVGILAADEGGTLTVARRYWSNRATNLVNDVPGEADLAPGLWGTFTLE